MRHVSFFTVPNKERITADKEVDAVLFGVSFTLWMWHTRLWFDEFVVARPKRELIYHVLRFRNINRGMTRTFDSFIAQIKRDLRRAIASVGNQKQFLTQFRFQIVRIFSSALVALLQPRIRSLGSLRCKLYPAA